MKLCRLWIGASIVATLLVAVGRADEPAPTVDFTHDVRPILSDNCFQCHGPDPDHREADLRLDLFESTDDAQGAENVISPGSPEDSYLVERITSEDDDRMPPPDSGKSLTPDEIATLRAWIAQGGKYQKHWAFVPPKRPPVPTVANASWVRNPIDAFILARLDKAGLEPSPEADANTLLRRLSLDLIGLPPTLEELDEVSDGEDAYRREVDRLLNSPHFGERWGRVWLDAARYADSDGFEKDKPRQVWMYRDWVINAINDDMPYDEFIVEQIAGDLLPNPTRDQLVATGFLRNSMVNQEGGIDPEQFRMEAMYDRMDAVGKAILGITVQCAQCHTHKYDPLTHTEYYRMFAFLNNCNEAQISVYTDEDEAERKSIRGEIRRIEDELRTNNPDWSERMAAWEAGVRDNRPEWTILRPELDGSGGQKHFLQEDGSILAAGYPPTQITTEFTVDLKQPKITAFRLELLNDVSLPRGGPGRSIYGLCALTEFQATAAPLDNPKKTTDLKFSAATADVNPPETELEDIFDDGKGTRRVTGRVEFAIDGDELTAWGIDQGPGRSNVPRKAVFVLDQPLEAADGVRITFKLVQKHGQPYEIDTFNNNLGRFRFSATSAAEVQADPLPSAVRVLLKIPADQRTAAQFEQLFSYWRTTVPEWREANDRIEQFWQSYPEGTSQLVLVEQETPRETHRLERGNFLSPAEVVSPGVPAFLHPLEDDSPNRLSFAHWLVDRRSPTTARSIVNRLWQAYFGIGLEMTAEDLGTQGEPPSNPELLDWLAVELMDNDWSLKHIHELIVTSSTYRQSSVVTPKLLERDPDNRLLARGSRFRVDAEVVRDVALSASGLLNPKIGGPSVYPPAPKFLFEQPASFAEKTWYYDTGPDKFRRALYTFRYRSVPYPALQTFDAPDGTTSCPRRARSNTPLQALTTLNESLFLECARALAVKVLAEGGTTDTQRMAYAVRLCLSREPKEDELEVLQVFLDRQKERYHTKQADPWPLISENKAESAELASNVSPEDLAAWTALARVVLNLDETITKE